MVIAIHGAILQTLMAAASDIPLAQLWLKTLGANGAIVRVAWTPGPGAGGRLRLLGPPSVAHLAPLGSAGEMLGSAGGPGPVA